LQGITNEAQTSFVADNYADDVVADFAYIRDELNSDSCHGSIVIFDGPPGSGKTHLVRYLINSSTKSKYILIPPEMVSSLTSPNLVAFLIQQATANKGRPMVFVLEDGDQALVPRDAGNVGVIQSLLNLTDGILGRALNIRILCTTNADSTAVDPAILRSGRLIRRTHVGFLPKKKAEAVMQRLGAEGKLPEPKVKPKAVGFGESTEEPRYLLADLYALANQFRVADPSPEPESVAGYEEEEEEVEYGREYEIGL
jgi:SpoVK/Ycf46/Vps4 family AAA+-type ATPase